MIVAYAGRRAGSFPNDAEDAVATRVRRLITALAPSAVVGPAADGGDLITLEATLKHTRSPTAHIVLPTTRECFRTASVEDGWRERFDRALTRVRELGGDLESLKLVDGDDAYRQCNTRVLLKAEELASRHERVIALAIAAPGEGMMVNDFVAQAQLRRIAVLRIDPSVDLATRPNCFVAMPFGSKYEPQSKLTVNCDQLYDKVLVPALENAQLQYRRADEVIDTGVVLEPMIESLSNADLVIGDLATGNFNVGWELGLRHLLRERHTVLMLPKGTSPPFDLQPLRHVSYQRTRRGISDTAAIAAWQQLEPYLAACEKPAMARSDSPVAAVMDVVQWAVVRPRRPPSARWESTRERLALARDLQDAGLTRTIVAEAGALPTNRRLLIHAEAGVDLVRMGAFADGEELLRELVRTDNQLLRPAAHIFYAQALYRPAEVSVEAFDIAEGVLRRLIELRPEYPEAWSGLGAINKRRSSRRDSDELRQRDIEGALGAYAHEYERDLDAYYAGINVVACGAVLEIAFEDRRSGTRARRVLPAVRLAAELARDRDRSDFWAAVTIAEALLHEVLLDVGAADAERAIGAYEWAGALGPSAGAIDSSITQLEWLAHQGVEHPLLDESAWALAQAAGADYPRRRES